MIQTIAESPDKKIRFQVETKYLVRVDREITKSFDDPIAATSAYQAAIYHRFSEHKKEAK